MGQTMDVEQRGNRLGRYYTIINMLQGDGQLNCTFMILYSPTCVT